MKRIIFLLVLACLLCGCADNSAVFELQTDDVTSEAVTTKADLTVDFLDETTSPSDICFVYVCGAVCEPGVYELPAGSRVYQAIELAGGMTDDAAIAAVNLVEVIFDGEQIIIPTEEEFASGWTQAHAEREEKESLVNINTASVSELTTLPGIGESRAEAIIAYREEYGRFESIEDIMNVSGIKDAAFSRIKGLITV